MSATTNQSKGVFDRGVLPVEVVILDIHTAEPIGIGAATVPSLVGDAELYQAETSAPEGPGAMMHEHRVWPRLMAVLGLFGLIAVGGLLYLRDGWDAAVVGIVWMAMGYSVAWIVVWAAGLARDREEREIERELDQRHRQG